MNKRSDALAETGSENKQKEHISRAQSKRSVYIYIGVLFVIVLLFILLSYFIEQRNNSELSTLNEKNATAQQNIENLQTLNLQLQAENETYKSQVSALEEQIDALEERIKKIQEEWRHDVANIRNSDAEQYNELLAKYNELAEKYGVKGD